MAYVFILQEAAAIQIRGLACSLRRLLYTRLNCICAVKLSSDG